MKVVRLLMSPFFSMHNLASTCLICIDVCRTAKLQESVSNVQLYKFIVIIKFKLNIIKKEAGSVIDGYLCKS